MFESIVPTHTIRLRGPWEYTPLARTTLLADGSRRVDPGPLPPPGQITMPADWGATLGADFRGRVAYRRRFGRPTGLTSEDRVDLVITRVDAFGSVQLNGLALGEIADGAGAWRCDVTARLAARNELVVEVELPRVAPGGRPLNRADRDALPGGLIGDVRLEIIA